MNASLAAALMVLWRTLHDAVTEGPASLLRGVVAVLLIALAASAHAGSPPLVLGQYRHTAWTASEGAPAGIRNIAQTRDGVLWLVSDSGLARFNGIAFESVQTLGGRSIEPGRVLHVKSALAGGLWIGFDGKRGMGRLRDGQLVEYPNPGAWASVQAMVEGPDGWPWIVADHKLWTIRGGVVDQIDAKWAYPAGTATSAVAADAKGTIWVVPSAGGDLYYAPAGETKLRRIQRAFAASQAVTGPGGELWLAGPDGLGLISNDGGQPGGLRTISKAPHGGLLLDRSGGLWVLDEAGFSHVANARTLLGTDGQDRLGPDTSARVDGMRSSTVSALFEDREGDVWVGTNAGLDRFHRPSFVSARLPPSSLVAAIAAGGDGDIWATSPDARLLKVNGLEYQPSGQADRDVLCLYGDGLGVIWMGGTKSLWRASSANGLVRLPVPDSLKLGPIRVITVDRSGGVWVGSDRGSARLADGQWSLPPGLGDGSPRLRTTAMHTDARDRVWIADPQGIAVIVNGVVVERFGYGENGLDIGTALSFYERGGNLWIGGSEGVALFDGAQFRSRKGRQDEPSFRGITGVVESPDGVLWLHGPMMVMRVPVEEMRRAMEHPSTTVDAFRFALDAIAGLDAPRPTLVRAGDGRLWVSTAAGLAWIDPSNLPEGPRSPDVLMRSLLVDGSRFEPSDKPPVVRPLSRRFELFWGAVSARMPLRLRFRYRLEGFDTTWQEVGERRSAFYNDLPPGSYRFHLMAASEDGLWGNGQTDFAFEVPAAWFQTLWFRVLCVLIVLALAVLGYRARARQLTRRVALLFAAKQSERERIARELHDTLLQGTQGLIFAVQSAANQIDAADPARAALERAMDTADAAMADGRSRIEELRSPTHALSEFPGALVFVGEQLAKGRGIAFSLEVRGTPRMLTTEVNDEVYDICREAILNAFQHAEPTRVSFVIAWERHALQITVSDDGVGIARDVLASKARTGHWGLAGMRERAGKVNATLNFRGGPDAGTTVELIVPSSIAYSRSPFRWFARRGS